MLDVSVLDLGFVGKRTSERCEGQSRKLRASEVQEPLRNIMKMVAPVGLRISVPLTLAFLLSLTYFQSDGLLAE